MIESNTTRLVLVRTLYFYDVPQLILLENQLGHLYLCLLSDDETMTYLGVSVSMERVLCLINGDLDLRDAYTSPEVQSYYLVTLNEEGTYMIDEETEVILSEALLPEEGFFLSSLQDDQERSIQEDLLIWRKPILKLGVSDSDNAHTIPVDKLSELTAHFSRFAKHLINKRASKGETVYPFVVYGTEAASFNLKMYIDTGFADLEFFGSSVDLYLQEIGDLLTWEGEDKFRQAIGQLKGHPLKSLRNFVSFLADNNFSLKYQWLSNSHAHSVYLKTSRADLGTIQSILQERTKLEIVILEAKGIITKASIENVGEWTLRTDDNKVISGRVEDSSILNGVTINRPYIIRYEDIIEVDIVSSKEHHRAILKSIIPIS